MNIFEKDLDEIFDVLDELEKNKRPEEILKELIDCGLDYNIEKVNVKLESSNLENQYKYNNEYETYELELREAS